MASCGCSCSRAHWLASSRGVIGLCLALWTVSVVPKLAGQNIPLESEVKLHWPVLIFTLGSIAYHGSSHGSLSGVAEFARRSGRWTQGRRTRNEWQSRSTSFPSRFGGGASWIIGRAAGLRRNVGFQVSSGSVGRKQGFGRTEFGRAELDCRRRNIPIPRRVNASRNDCRWNCRLLPASKLFRSRTPSHSPEIVRRRLMHARMEIRCR